MRIKVLAWDSEIAEHYLTVEGTESSIVKFLIQKYLPNSDASAAQTLAELAAKIQSDEFVSWENGAGAILLILDAEGWNVIHELDDFEAMQAAYGDDWESEVKDGGELSV